MAWTSGTATGVHDLYNKLRDFVVGATPPPGAPGTALPVAQRWVQIAGNTGTLVDGDKIILQGPGLGAADQILVAMKTVTSAASDYYNLGFNGLVSYNPALGDADVQINTSGNLYIHLWDDVIDYWFVANGRRFMVIARVSSNWFCSYAGFTLPFSLPSMYPYPMFIGGASGVFSNRWSLVDQSMKSFFDPHSGSTKMLFPDVLWYSVYNWQNNNPDGFRSDGLNIDPWHNDFPAVRENLDGSYPLMPAVIHCTSPYAAQMARLDGVFCTSGFSNSAGSIITNGGVDHLVVPNIYRNGLRSFAAFALE